MPKQNSISSHTTSTQWKTNPSSLASTPWLGYENFDCIFNSCLTNLSSSIFQQFSSHCLHLHKSSSWHPPLFAHPWQSGLWPQGTLEWWCSKQEEQIFDERKSEKIENHEMGGL